MKSLKLTLVLFGLTLFTILGINSVSAETPDLKPNSTVFVKDNAKILSDSTIKMVNSQNKSYSQTNEKPQIAIITVDSTDGKPIGEWTHTLLKQHNWNIGNASENNGIIIVFAKNNGANNIRIETGSGLTSLLTSDKLHQLLIDNNDNLKSSDTSQINTGLQVVMSSIHKTLTSKYLTSGSEQKTQDASDSGLGALGIIPILAIIIISIAIVVIFIKIIFLNKYMDKTLNENSDEAEEEPTFHSTHQSEVKTDKALKSSNTTKETTNTSTSQHNHYQNHDTGYRHDDDDNGFINGIITGSILNSVFNENRHDDDSFYGYDDNDFGNDDSNTFDDNSSDSFDFGSSDDFGGGDFDDGGGSDF